MMRNIILVLLAIMAVSCSTTKQFAVTPSEEFESVFVGLTANDIMDAYGKPTRIDANGEGVILVYESVVEEFRSSEDDSDTATTTNSYGMEESSDEGETVASGNYVTVYKYFYLDRDCYCYKVDTNDYIKGGVYRKYFNKITIVEMSIIAVLAIIINLIA